MSSIIPPLNPTWFERAAAYQARLTMPAGALGRLLELGRQLCAIQETLQPQAEPAAVVVMAADHGIAEEGVSAYPQTVTAQMVANFLRGGAAINVLARRQGARFFVVDLGIKDPSGLGPHPHFIGNVVVGRGTMNFLRGPAMTREQALKAVAAGRRIVSEQLVPLGVRVLALGEMGIGNTTSASALTAALLGREVATVTGRGTGLDDNGWKHKVDVVARSVRKHFPNPTEPVDPLAVLTAVGGFEIAGLVGAALDAAAHRMMIVLDGFISSVAGLIACRMEPAVRAYCVAAHRSVEIGHRAVLEALELTPLLDLELRLGEGSGAALALNLLQCSADILRDMATFDRAGVSDRES